MSRDYPTLDEQYGPGAEQADAEAQDDVATELQEAIDSPFEYNHRYWTEVAGRAVEKLRRLETAARRYAWISEHWDEITGFTWKKSSLPVALDEYVDSHLSAATPPSGEVGK